MKPNKITSATLALAAVALLAPQVHAQSYVSGDLLLGFTEAGASNDYIVNIGPASTYINAASSFTVSDGNIGADLSSSSLFGSTWYSNSSVQWGIAGTNTVTGSTSGLFGLPTYTLFLTAPEDHSPLTERVGSTQKGYDSKIDSSLGDSGYNQASGTTTNSNGTAVIESASGTDSWTTLSANAFGYGNLNTIASDNTPDTSVLDLYELQPHSGSTTPGTLLGDFSLSQSGALTFTPASVPEPSSYALGVTSALMLLWVLRRRKNVA